MLKQSKKKKSLNVSFNPVAFLIVTTKMCANEAYEEDKILYKL